MVPSKRKAIHVNDVSDARFEAKYAAWKERLLDLTASNRLLNFRETRVSTVQITFSDPLAASDVIALHERSPKAFPQLRPALLRDTGHHRGRSCDASGLRRAMRRRVYVRSTKGRRAR